MNTINRITPFTRFTEEELSNLSEKEIIIGFKVKNPQITQRYFYGYCTKAYTVWDKKYQLIGKEGLDFYTLSNDYYIRMVNTDWKELEEERETASLETWIVGGFLFTVLDALKKYNVEQEKIFKSLPIENYHEKISNLADYTLDIDLVQIRDVIIKDNTNNMIFDKYIIKGYSMKEIAKELNISSSAVSQRYKSIIKTIAQYYKSSKL